MRKTFFLMQGISLFLLLMGSAMAGTIKEYAADQVILDPKTGAVELAGKVYVSGERMRFDMPKQKKIPNISTVFLPAQKKIYLIAHDQKIYAELPMSDQRLPGNIPIPAGKLLVVKDEKKDLGQEVINGYKTRKQEHELTATVLGKTQNTITTVWMADEFNLPLRTSIDKDDQIQEMRNIVIGPPPAGVFDLPAGYVQMNSLLEILGGLIK